MFLGDTKKIYLTTFTCRFNSDSCDRILVRQCAKDKQLAKFKTDIFRIVTNAITYHN